MKKIYLAALLVGLMSVSLSAQLVEVVDGLSFPFGLVLDDNDLYVSQNGGNKISKFDITDGDPMLEDVLLTSGPGALILKGDSLFIGKDGGITKINITDDVPVEEVVLSGLSDLVVGFALDGNILYYTVQLVGSVFSLDLSQPGTPPVTIASGFSIPFALELKGSDLYVSDFNSNSISKIDLTASPATVSTVVTGLAQPGGITFNGNFLYVAEESRVSRIDINQNMPTAETVVTGLQGSRLVAFDGIDMYVAEVVSFFGANGKISKLTIGTPVFSNLGTVCTGTVWTDLGGASPTGGTYSGTGVTDNGDGETFTFDPAAAGGVGSYTITYTATNGESVTSTLEVTTPPTVTFSTGGLSVQVDAGVQAGLGGGMPTGGVYSGPGVTDDGNGMTYSFDPAVAGEGENVITYTFTDANGCGGEQGAIITVIPVLTPGAALDFDGVDDRVVVPHENLLDNLTGDYTIGAWVKLNNNTTNQPIFCYTQTSTTSYVIFGANFPALNNRPYFVISAAGGGNDQIVAGSSPLSINEWHHIVASYEASSTTLTLYVDGEVAGSSTNITVNPSSLDVTDSYVGYYPVGTISGYFSGQIDELRITSSASSCYEVNQQASCELPADDPNLEVYYQFNQDIANTGVTTLDATVGPDGTLENFALMGMGSDFVEEGAIVTGTMCDPVVESAPLVTGSGMLIDNEDDTPSADDGSDLGDVFVGASQTATFSVINAGPGSTFMVDTIISSNPLFTIMADTDEPVTSMMPINFEVTFMPTAAGQESAVITVVTDDCVVGDYTFTVQGNALPMVEFMAPADLCLNAGVQTGLGGGTPEGGVYSGPGVTDDGNGMTYSFDPAAAGVGVHTITYSLQGATATDDIEVFTLPTVTFTPAVTTFTIGTAVGGILGGSPSGGVYSGPGVTDSGNGMSFSFNPDVPGVGTHTLTYTFTDANGCTGTATADVVVEEAMLVTGDMCTDAIDINPQFGQAPGEVQSSGPYDNTNATTDDSDPDFGFECFGEPDGLGGAPSLERTLWYTFEGDGNNYFIEALACGDDPIDFGDTQFVIYAGPNCDSLEAVLCSEDGPSTMAGGPFPAGDTLQTEAGVNYYIMVDGFGPDFPADGEFCLEVTNLTEPVVPVTVTFQVDATLLVDNGELAADGMFLAGSFSDFNNIAMEDMDGDNVWTAEVEVDAGTSQEYKFKNGADGWENIDTGLGDDCTTGEFGNRALELGDMDMTLDPVCFAYCVSCMVVDVDEAALEAGVSIFPNPVRDVLNVQVDLPTAADALNIRLLNTLGQVVLSSNYGQLQSDNIELDMSQLPAGTYLLQVRDGRAQFARSVVVQR